MSTPPRNLTLRIEKSEGSIRGTLGDEAGASRGFSGWLGFARALEQVLAERKGPSPEGSVLLHHPQAGGQVDPVE